MQTQTIVPQPSEIWFLIADDGDGTETPNRVPVTPPFRIGRREGCDLCLPSQNVSGLHAEILEEEEGQLWLYDLNSTNGTFLNEQRIRERIRLREDDSVLFGNCRFSVARQSEGAARHPMATIESGPLEVEPETPEEKFQRLLDSGTTPCFQPIYDISGAMRQRIGYEVLGRSRMFGLQTPDQMFAAALEFEKEAKLSRVLRRRGVEAAEADLPKDLMLFVNTHPTELESGDLKESLNEIRESFPARDIVLEVPESILNSPDSFSEIRQQLLDLDILLAIHDFGAGQIRLSELSEMAPDIVKFDGALIQGIDKATSKRRRLVSAMTKMVRELGITAMAEYIEYSGEHQTLKQLGIQYAQGFHYGRPIDIKDLSSDSKEQTSESRTALSSKHRKSSNRSVVEELKQIDEPSRKSNSEINEVRDADWLLAQSEDCYTIQLTMSSLESRATKFVAQQALPGDYAVYRKRGRINDWYVVVFGIYKDRETAKADSLTMKSEGVSPWIRTLSTIHTEIRAAAAIT
jgi:EAL domain-containing protein (putative c-di-GMP-specific phosphodiesterase class I)